MQFQSYLPLERGQPAIKNPIVLLQRSWLIMKSSEAKLSRQAKLNLSFIAACYNLFLIKSKGKLFPIKNTMRKIILNFTVEWKHIRTLSFSKGRFYNSSHIKWDARWGSQTLLWQLNKNGPQHYFEILI